MADGPRGDHNILGVVVAQDRGYRAKAATTVLSKLDIEFGMRMTWLLPGNGSSDHDSSDETAFTSLVPGLRWG
jgi:hypothetical protein